jgi:SAM-dependent methyltransferase
MERRQLAQGRGQGDLVALSDALDTHVAAYEGNNIYDFDNRILLYWYARRILALTQDASSLLELGIGHGFTALTFSGHFARHSIIEGSPAVIANFRRNHPGPEPEIVETFFETYATEEAFDVIVMGFVLEHVDDPALLLRRYRALLAPQGRIYVAVPNAEVLNRRLGWLAGMLPDMQLLSEHDRLLGHKRYFTVHSLRDLVERSGFAIERLEGIYLKPLATHQMISLDLDERIIDALCRIGADYPELSCGILAELTAVDPPRS